MENQDDIPNDSDASRKSAKEDVAEEDIWNFKDAEKWI